MKTKGTVTYRGRSYQVTPGTLRALAMYGEGPSDAQLLYKLLRAEGYTAAELERPARDGETWVQMELFEA